MDKFIARQPIFDHRSEVQGYELLFRSGLENVFGRMDEDVASSMVIVESLFLPGFEGLTGGKPAFVNVTRGCLFREDVTLLPPATTVLEILESIEGDEEVVAACRRLRERGYRIALDDFRLGAGRDRLLDVCDIVKVDILETPPEERAAVARKLRPRGLVLLAEKVETEEAFRQTRGAGYQLFQGYYFACPTVLCGRDIPAQKMSHVRLLAEIHRPDLDLPALRAVIEHEVGLSYKLLRYMNSAFFGRKEAVGSILHALILLGEREVKRWASLIALAGMTSDKPDELQLESLYRGRFCELLASQMSLQSRASDLFLMGLLSLVEAMLDCPIAQLLERLPLAEDVQLALLGEPGRLRDVLELAIRYGRGDWEALAEPLGRLRLDEDVLPEIYAEAMRWSGQFVSRDRFPKAA